MTEGADRVAKRIAAFVLDRERRREAERATRLVEGREDARIVAAALRERFGVRRVVLFGSLATGRVSQAPDIDLAVSGLEPGRRCDAYAAVAPLARLPLDLIELERARPTVRARIESEGVELL